MVKVIICEKKSVGVQFAHALSVNESHDGYIEGNGWIITWAVGHLVTLAEPHKYDEKYKKWNIDDLPIMPERYKYQIISTGAKQYKIVKEILQEAEVIYNAGDAGREGEYIQRLIYNMAGVEGKKKILRVWIDSQTDSEILRGIREAKPESEYNNLSEAGYARAISDWLIGMNFTRGLTTKFSYELNRKLGITDYKKYARLNVGRVMTCVLGLVVDRENEIKNFKPVDYYKIDAVCEDIRAHWKAVEGSRYYNSEKLYNESGFKDKEAANALINEFARKPTLFVEDTETTVEKKNAPLLFSLAELQGECTKLFKISPDETLEIAESLYLKKMTTYPRTDARVISSAVAKEIDVNLNGLKDEGILPENVKEILDNGWYKNIGKTRYCDDSKITDHYAIIPTGEYTGGLSDIETKVYQIIVKRFLSIFYPPAEYSKTSVVFKHENGEKFFAAEKHLVKPGFFNVAGVPKAAKENEDDSEGDLTRLKKGESVSSKFEIQTSTTQPPKRYTSGSMILAMENAGKLIEDEELRAQIKDSGIGTSATRAEVLKKLTEDVHHLKLDKKTQILTPTDIGYGVYEIVKKNVPNLLSPKMTASWEKGLSQIEKGQITKKQYLDILNKFIIKTVDSIKTAQAEQGESYKKVESKEIGTCPICGGKLLESEKAIYCASRVKDKEKGCHFLFSKTLGGKPLAEEHIKRLLSGQDTDLITGIPTKDGGSTFECFITVAKDGKVAMKFPAEETHLKCPKCGKAMEKGKFAYTCSCGMSFFHTISDRTVSEDEMERLFSDMLLGPVDGFKTKEGKAYSAYLLFNGKNIITVKSVISGRNISRDEAINLLENGKTEKLDGFKGSNGEFSAILKVNNKGYVEFEFPDSSKKGSGKGKTKGKGKGKGLGAYKKWGLG